MPNWRSVLQEAGDDDVHDAILQLLCALITQRASFLELEWLDIELQCDHFDDYDLINTESLCNVSRLR